MSSTATITRCLMGEVSSGDGDRSRGRGLSRGLVVSGNDDLAFCKRVVRELIDRFNAALVELVEVPLSDRTRAMRCTFMNIAG